MNVFVINLERHQERILHMQDMARKNSFEFSRVKATDWKDLSEADFLQHFDKQKSESFGVTKFEKGLIACGLSHLECWKRIQSSGVPGCILEDDIVVQDGFGTVLQEVFAKIKPNEVILLTGTNESLHFRLFKEKLSSRDLEIVYVNSETKNGAGYVLGAEAAKILVDEFYPIYFPNDWWCVSRAGFRGKVVVRAMQPPLVIQDVARFGSETGHSKPAVGAKKLPRKYSRTKLFKYGYLKIQKVWVSSFIKAIYKKVADAI